MHTHVCFLLVSKKELWPHPAEPFISWGWPPLSNKGSIWLMTEIYMLTYAFLIRRLGMIFLAVALVPNFIMSVLLRLCPAKSAFNNHHIKNCCWQGKGSRFWILQSNKNMWLLFAISPSAIPDLSQVYAICWSLLARELKGTNDSCSTDRSAPCVF